MSIQGEAGFYSAISLVRNLVEEEIRRNRKNKKEEKSIKILEKLLRRVDKIRYH